jgi:hypothetical protein
MNNLVLQNYGITFNRLLQNNQIIIKAHSYNLAIYLDKFTREKSMLQEIIYNIDLVINGNIVSTANKEWSVELGLQLYTGIIQNNLTFDLFLEDHYNETLETFPLYDMKEIFQSLLEFLEGYEA